MYVFMDTQQAYLHDENKMAYRRDGWHQRVTESKTKCGKVICSVQVNRAVVMK